MRYGCHILCKSTSSTVTAHFRMVWLFVRTAGITAECRWRITTLFCNDEPSDELGDLISVHIVAYQIF